MDDHDHTINIALAIEELHKEKNGEKALKILHIIAYFASNEIQTDIFLFLVCYPAELKEVFILLERRSLIRPGVESKSIVISKRIQNHVRNYLKEKKMEERILTLAMRLISENLTNPSNLYHAMSVCSYAKEYPKLVKELSGLPSMIVTGLMKHNKYKEASFFGNESFDFLRKAINEQHPAVLSLQHNLAVLLGIQGKYKEALELLLPLYEKDCKFSEQNEINHTLITTARQLSESSQYAEALLYYEKIFRRTSVTDTNDKTLLSGWHDYALLLNDLNFTSEAEEILQELLIKEIGILDEDDDEICSTKMSIAHVLLKQSKYSEALKYFQEVYNKRREHLGEIHEDTLRTRRDIALSLQNLGVYDEALSIFEEVAENFDKVLGKTHPDSLATRANLASIFHNKGEYEKSYHMYKDIYEKQRITLGEKQLETLRVKHNIGSILLLLDQKEEALQMLEEVLEGFREILGPRNKETEQLQCLISNNRPAETLLHSLARNGDFDELASLIRIGTNINIKDKDGNTPLHKAVQYDHFEIVKLLLKYGAIYNPRNNESITPLGLSRNSEIQNLFTLVESFFENVKNRNIEQVLRNISAESIIINARDYEGQTALHWAVSENHKDMLQILLEKGADATMVTSKYNTPLHIAVSKKHYEIILLLLKSVNADQLNKIINTKTLVMGNTPLHIAVEKGHLDVVKILLKYGAMFDIENRDGKTALTLAVKENTKTLLTLIDSLFKEAQNGNNDIISKLQNIDPKDFEIIMKARNKQGHTLVQAAIVNKQSNIAKKLLKLLKDSYQKEYN